MHGHVPEDTRELSFDLRIGVGEWVGGWRERRRKSRRSERVAVCVGKEGGWEKETDLTDACFAGITCSYLLNGAVCFGWVGGWVGWYIEM